MSSRESETSLLKRLGPLLKWGIALGILAVLFYKNWDTLNDFSLTQVRWEFALLGFILVLLVCVLTFVRWHMLVRAQDFELSLSDALRLGFLGLAFSYVLPGAVSGDFVKAGVLAMRQKSRRTVAFATVILDRLVGLFALFVVGGAVWLAQTAEMQHPVFHTFAAVFAIGSAIGLAGLLITMHTPIMQAGWLQWFTKLKFVGGILEDMLNAVAVYRSKKGIVWLSVAISLLGHVMMLSAFYFCALAMNGTDPVPGYFAHLLFMPVAELAGMIPIVPGGVGVLEAATAQFYVYAGYDGAKGFLTGTAFRVISIIIAGAGGAYGFSAKRKFQDAMHESTDLATA